MNNLKSKDLYEINQLCKGMRIDNSYTLYDNKGLMFKRVFEMTKQGVIREDVGFTIAEYDKYNFDNIYHIDNGVLLYDVYKGDKGTASHTKADFLINCKEVEVYSKEIDDLKYRIPIVDSTKDIELFEKHKSFIYDDNNIVDEFYLGESKLTDILDYKLLEIKVANKGHIRLTKSLFKGLGLKVKKSDIDNTYMQIKVWDIEHDVYVIVINMKSKGANLKHIYKTILY